MKDYIQQAVQTEAPGDVAIARFNSHKKLIRLLHSAMGMETEVGEFMDQLKKHIFYGKDLDWINLIEELGDLFWYIAITCDCLSTDFETIMERNIAKLRSRYPNKFTEYDAQNRNLEKERAILEKEFHESYSCPGIVDSEHLKLDPEVEKAMDKAAAILEVADLEEQRAMVAKVQKLGEKWEKKHPEGIGTCSADPEEQKKIWKSGMDVSGHPLATQEEWDKFNKRKQQWENLIPEIAVAMEELKRLITVREKFDSDPKSFPPGAETWEDFTERCKYQCITTDGNKVGLWLSMDLDNEQEWHLAKNIKKLLFNCGPFASIYNQIEQKMISHIESQPPLKKGAE